jgi:tetratricopeptide (TPR) repeat protein
MGCFALTELILMSRARDHKKLFLSAVSSEFESYRKLLSDDLKRPTLDVAVQEDFIVSGGSTLQKLDDYIRACDGIVHLIGKAVGAVPEAVAVQAFLKKNPDLASRLSVLADRLSQPDPGFSYTQWEAYLAIYHERPVFIYRPTDFDLDVCHCPREARFVHDPDQAKAQEEHYRRICALGRDRGQFLNPERLSSAVLRDLVDILPTLEKRIDVPPSKLRHTAEKLIGRDAELTLLDNAWNEHRNIVVVRGKGGEGKTSLVASWMAELALKDWRGADGVFDWSFYSQGTRDQTAASADIFINAALIALGAPDPTLGGAEERGVRLAKLVGARRFLLVLDGLEPLQYPPGPMHGQLKDPGMAALLRGLAGHNTGLCVVTTREKVDEIKHYYGKTAVDYPLEFLSPPAGAALLHYSGAQCAGHVGIEPDDPELQMASKEVHGHALTLFLIGLYLRLTEDGDIRCRDHMKLAEADAEYKNDPRRSYGHAFKAIEAYETWFAAGDVEACRQLAILRLLGLFDRPAPPDCLRALREKPIVGLNDQLQGISEKEWKTALARLQEINLVDVSETGAVDCHPLFREYFANRLKSNEPKAFREAHSRLFDHLCATTPHRPDVLEGLGPLYQAVVHGCLAGRHSEANHEVFRDRILRGRDFYSTKKLGAIGADLSAVAAFFEEPWSRISSNLSESEQGSLFALAAFNLRALGRLTEAVEPTRMSLKVSEDEQDWENAARRASNLSELEVTLGRLEEGVADARRSIEFADRGEDWFQKVGKRTTAADALHEIGEWSEAEALFVEAEQIQAKDQAEIPLLYSVQGFQYVDLLLAPAERATWQAVLRGSGLQSPINKSPDPGQEASIKVCTVAERRAAYALKIAIDYNLSLLSIAFDHLTLARARLYKALIFAAPQTEAAHLKSEITTALAKLRQANSLNHLPKALLTAALYCGSLGKQPDEARRYLAEAQQIAERGPMPLYLADVHLHCARLFRDKGELAKARAFIEKHGYWRRKEELEDAEAAL